MKKIPLFLITLFLVFLFFAFIVFGEGEPTEAWVAMYDGPVNGYDFTTDIAIDASGNVYVTGPSWHSYDAYWDYATIKYDSDGGVVWVARYNGPGNAGDYASNIAVDTSGNVYVIGRGWGIGIRWDYTTIKYSQFITVEIDIKPGSCPNPLNTKSKGVLPVAVLGTEDFDVTTIDPATIQLSRDGVEGGVSPIRWNYEDVATPFEGELCDCHDLNGDGYLDLTLKFKTQELVETLNLEEVAGETIPLILTGKLKEEEGATSIRGSDCIKVLKTGKK